MLTSWTWRYEAGIGICIGLWEKLQNRRQSCEWLGVQWQESQRVLQRLAPSKPVTGSVKNITHVLDRSINIRRKINRLDLLLLHKQGSSNESTSTRVKKLTLSLLHSKSKKNATPVATKQWNTMAETCCLLEMGSVILTIPSLLIKKINSTEN